MNVDFLDGNQMIARGALAAGCDFFAGYPITPASSILFSMLEELPKHGGVGIQAEDEIASIGFCIGASMAGRKAFTATSGPGLSLYSENIGLAIMGETPLVIADVQRHGPATGSATKDGASDIQFARWSTSGGYPIIALVPTNARECFTFTMLAFNYAEQFRTPVFILSSKEIGMTKEKIDWSKVEKPEIINRKYHTEGKFIPYRFEKSEDIPEFLPYGRDEVIRYTTSTHDENGLLITDPEKIQKMMDHLNDKISADKITLVEKDLQEGAETLVISYGVTSRSAKAAIQKARKLNHKVSSLVIYSVWPVPEKEIINSLKNIKKVIVPEMNTGQYILEIERFADRDVLIKGINLMNTKLINPEKIFEAII